MITLQEYLTENINEGAILDSIKKWFKSLFEPSDKEFDRYGKDKNRIEGENLVKFKKYLEDNFTEESIEIQQFEDFKKLNKAIYPNGVEPNKDENFGFYEFTGELDEKSQYFGLIYKDKNVKDTACLVNSKTGGDDVEIIKLQVIQEFTKYLPIKNVINLLKKSSEFVGSAKRLIVKEKVNKNLYNQVINDCKFEKLYENSENIAALKLNEESK
jgi:hypothetical protein